MAEAALWFEPLLDLIPHEVTQVVLRKGGVVYAQGQKADGVYFVKKGKVRRSVLSKAGQIAVLGVLTPGEFCGEGCLSGQARRVSSTTAVTAATVVRVEAAALAKALHGSHELSEAFLAHLLARNITVEKGFCGQLFNHLGKRLARVLLKLSCSGQEAAYAEGHTISATISLETLAKMIGTTRSRVNAILDQFCRLGLIDYSGETPDGAIRVHPELLTDVVLSDY